MKKIVLLVSVFSALWITAIVVLFLIFSPNNDAKTYHHTISIWSPGSNYGQVEEYIEKRLKQYNATNIEFSQDEKYLILDYDITDAAYDFEKMVCLQDLTICRTLPVSSDDIAITLQDIESASVEHEQSDDTYSVYITLYPSGKKKLSDLTSKYSGDFLNVYLDYESIYLHKDVTPITDGVYCVRGIKTKQKACDLADTCNKPYFTLYSSSSRYVKNASSD